MSERQISNDEAEIVIVREKRFSYRWTASTGTSGWRRDTGVAFTARAARRAAMARIHGFSGWVLGRVEREEIRVAVRSSSTPLPPPPEKPELELLDA